MAKHSFLSLGTRPFPKELAAIATLLSLSLWPYAAQAEAEKEAVKEALAPVSSEGGAETRAQGELFYGLLCTSKVELPGGIGRRVVWGKVEEVDERKEQVKIVPVAVEGAEPFLEAAKGTKLEDETSIEQRAAPAHASARDRKTGAPQSKTQGLIASAPAKLPVFVSQQMRNRSSLRRSQLVRASVEEHQGKLRLRWVEVVPAQALINTAKTSVPPHLEDEPAAGDGSDPVR